jgi:cell filamentation protein
MNSIAWRWEEKDFGFRFRDGRGRRASEYYQARCPAEFYVVPSSHRKLSKERIEELAAIFPEAPSTQVVANPWRDYERGWDWIVTEDGICLNWAGCLDREEICRREDEGVQRAMELVADLVTRSEAVPLSVRLIQQIHVELMGAIYPFAGAFRTVALHKGDGPTRWPLPPSGIQPLMDVLERDVLSRSPVISDKGQKIFAYASEVMNEFLAIHPFREGNGRAAFILGNLILMQNDMLPLTTYERRPDEARYFAACEAGRIQKDYEPLAALLAEWEDRALAEWETRHG